MARLAIVPLIVVGLAACERKESPSTLPPTPSASEKAADRLLPGELAEGRERMMGLAVPRDMRVVRVFDDSAVASGRVDLESVSNYVRKRVDAASAEIGAARTLFPRAHVKGQPDEKVVRIEIVRQIGSTELLFYDITPPVHLPGLSDEERWRKAGVIPGKPIDPNAL
jgi:hypothetical protein